MRWSARRAARRCRASASSPVDRRQRANQRRDARSRLRSAGDLRRLHADAAFVEPARRPAGLRPARFAFLPVAARVPLLLCAGAVAGEDGLAACVAAGFAQGTAGRPTRGPKPALSAIWPRSPRVMPAGCGRRGGGGDPRRRRRGRRAGLRRPATRRQAQRPRAGPSRGLRLGRALKRYTTSGMATDQGKTADVNVLAGLAELSGVRDGRGRHHHLPPAVHADRLRRHRRARARPALPPDAADAMHDWHAAHGAHLHRCRAVAAPVLLSAPRRGLAEAAAREARARAPSRRAGRCLDARQDRRAGAGCRGIARPGLCQRLPLAQGRVACATA